LFVTAATVAITLIENFRSVFYIPFYAPVALGAYAAEGLDVSIKPSPEAARTIHALIDGEGDISWGGLSRLMGGLERDAARAPVAVCEVISRDPFFLVAREPNADFRLRDLLARRVAVVSEVPGPSMCFDHDLRLAGIDPRLIARAPQRSMAYNAAALRAGEVDVVQIPHPYAHELTAEGSGHVWHAAAKRGPATYTTLNTTRDFASRKPDVMLRLCRAMYRAQRWIAAHDGREIANAVGSFFPHLPRATLAACCDDYKALGVWASNPIVSRAGFEYIRDAGLTTGRVPKRYELEDCVDSRFAEQAVQQDPPPL
jgi:NitT/TauT family transport system substrate-binding protein